MKKPTRKTLIRRLDKLVGDIVKARDKKCVQCGSTLNITCGHVFSRANYSTRWDLRNCYAQCLKENMRHEFDPYPFLEYARKKLGEKEYHNLHRLHSTPSHFKNHHLQEMLNELSKELEKYGQ